MQNTPFQAFIGKVRASRRLLYGDLQRLQRDVLPKGIQDRHQAEALIALEGVLERFDDGWPGFLAGALKAFVLSMSSRPGIVDRETADWLASVLEHLSRKVAAGIAREIILEAGQVDGALLTRVERPLQGRGRGRARAPSGQDAGQPATWPSHAYGWGAVSVIYGEERGAAASGGTSAAFSCRTRNGRGAVDRMSLSNFDRDDAMAIASG
jgi:hypothetical protein